MGRARPLRLWRGYVNAMRARDDERTSAGQPLSACAAGGRCRRQRWPLRAADSGIQDSHVGAVEVLERSGCRRAALTLITVAVGAGAVGVLGRRRETEVA